MKGELEVGRKERRPRRRKTERPGGGHGVRANFCAAGAGIGGDTAPAPGRFFRTAATPPGRLENRSTLPSSLRVSWTSSIISEISSRPRPPSPNALDPVIRGRLAVGRVPDLEHERPAVLARRQLDLVLGRSGAVQDRVRDGLAHGQLDLEAAVLVQAGPLGRGARPLAGVLEQRDIGGDPQIPLECPRLHGFHVLVSSAIPLPDRRRPSPGHSIPFRHKLNSGSPSGLDMPATKG